jgi:cytochrome c-type biogenesis protein CcmH
MLARLESRLAQDPNDPDGWYTLARSYMVLKQYAKAESAYRQLHSLVGDQAEILLGLADAMTMTRNGDMRGEPFELAKRALELEPENPTALWLTGIGYRDNGDRVTAISLWKKLLPLISSDPQSVHEVRTLIQQAETQLGGKLAADVPPTAAITASSINTPASTASIMVRVELDPESANHHSATDYVMVYAQRSTGMKMPLAMYKAQVKDLPMTITLSDDLALSPMNKLSSADQVKLVARISKSGQAIKQPGDIEVVSGPHSVADTDRITLRFSP